MASWGLNIDNYQTKKVVAKMLVANFPDIVVQGKGRDR
jgi:hypothetical protein